MANWEHDVLGENWEVVKTKAVRDRGSHLAPAPLGYRHGLDGGVLAPDPETSGVVVAMFERRAAGGSWAELVDLYDEAVPRPRGRRIRRDAERIIRSRVYRGETRWRDQIREGAHEALVNEDLWQRANMMVTFEPARRKPPKTREFPLSGWLRCYGCGRTMGGSVFRGRERKEIACYTCNGRRGGCPQPQTITAEPVERWVLNRGAERYAERRRVAVDDVDSTELDAAIARVAESARALHDLASTDMRRALGEDWMPMMQRLRAEKAVADHEVQLIRQRFGMPTGISIPWAEMDDLTRWTTLRDMAPLGVLVSPVVRWRDPVARLSFVIDEDETNAVPEPQLPQ